MTDKSLEGLEAFGMDVVCEDSIITEPPFPEFVQLCDDLEFVSKEHVLRNKHTQHYFLQA